MNIIMLPAESFEVLSRAISYGGPNVKVLELGPPASKSGNFYLSSIA